MQYGFELRAAGADRPLNNRFLLGQLEFVSHMQSLTRFGALSL
jgi:hypothetical protein